MKNTTKNMIINSSKIILAATLAIFLAQALQLDFALSAGIVAILSVQPSKRETVHTALSRLYGFAASLLIGIICYNLLGFTIWTFCVYVAIYIVVCQIFKWYSSMAMNSVLISHFITLGNTSFPSVANEVLIFVIGVGFGILVNLHLHKNIEAIERLKAEMDDKIVYTLHRMSLRILDSNLPNYDGSCFVTLRNSLSEAKSIAKENYNNQLNNNPNLDGNYIKMREQQIHILSEMYKRVKNVKTSPVTAKIISDFLEKISVEYARENNCISLLGEFQELWNKMKSQPLPTTREEFEDRAELYTLLEYIEEFLQTKKSFACEV